MCSYLASDQAECQAPWATCFWTFILRKNIYLRQGGYVFASVSLCVCVCVCVCVIKITQKVTDQFLRKF